MKETIIQQVQPQVIERKATKVKEYTGVELTVDMVERWDALDGKYETRTAAM